MGPNTRSTVVDGLFCDHDESLVDRSKSIGGPGPTCGLYFGELCTRIKMLRARSAMKFKNIIILKNLGYYLFTLPSPKTSFAHQ